MNELTHDFIRLLAIGAVASATTIGCGSGTDSATADTRATSEPTTSAPTTSELAYDPDIDPERFVNVVDHPYFPLPDGATWTYEVTTPEGSTDVLETTVTDETRTVMGVGTTVVEVTLTVDGELEERTLSWYAQDDTGAVWLFGEIDEGYESGELVEKSTWEAGVDDALPGTFITAEGAENGQFRVGFVADEMEERGRLLAIDATASVPIGSYEGVWVIENWSDLEPDVSERKHYAPSVGLVLVDSDDPDTDTVRLVATSLSS